MFPNSRYDDQVDATSQALDWLQKRPTYWAFMKGQEIYNATERKESADEVEPIGSHGWRFSPVTERR